jgi:hypothetical protein
MRNILKNRTALSTVVTTLIILVVSVLLAGVVTYFAINVTSTRVQEENLNMMYQHVWYNSSSGAQAAVLITNTGGRDVVLNKIAVRGQVSAWSNVYYNTSAVTGDDLTIQDLSSTPTDYAKAASPLILKSGETMAFFVDSPDSISVNDIGLTVAISIFSSQAIYYKETNVEADSTVVL